jgi:hypothetical protein
MKQTKFNHSSASDNNYKINNIKKKGKVILSIDPHVRRQNRAVWKHKPHQK